jgi:hypothetical protein
MAEERRYGVECKNKQCSGPIIFGRYLVSQDSPGGAAAPAALTPGRLRCSACGSEFDYTSEDMLQFPAESVNPSSSGQIT